MCTFNYEISVSFVEDTSFSCSCYVQEQCLDIGMTPVTSAAKMVGQLRRWLIGDEVISDSHSAENVSGHCGTCTCNSATNKLHYRGRSYSDCCTTSCRCHNTTVRERSCSVNSWQMTSHGSKNLSSRTYQTSSGSTWSSGHRRDVHDVLDEDREPCRYCSESVEPVCCCERCFVYVDERPPLLPQPYSELMLLERCADLAKRLTDTEPSITVNAADATDRVMVGAEAAIDCTLSSAETCQSATVQSCTVSTASPFLCTLLESL